MKRGCRPQGKVQLKWTHNFAYAIGLLVTDGNVSPDGRHIDFTSKDKIQVVNFIKALGVKNKIGIKRNKNGEFFRVQVGDVILCRFLEKIGITPAKSKTIGDIDIPDEYFFDFLRGSFDGDGTIYSYWDKRWKSSFMFYLAFTSASPRHIAWLRSSIKRLTDQNGHISKSKDSIVIQLRYAKQESFEILKCMYGGSKKKMIYLPRKRLKTNKILGSIGQVLS